MAAFGAAQPFPYFSRQSESPIALLIDGRQGVRGAIVKDLTGAGWFVLACHSGAEGLALARKNQPDVVIIDLHYEAILGESLLESLNEASPMSRKVVVTEGPLGSNMVKVLCAGADDVLTTPITMRAVVGSAGCVAPAQCNPAESPFWSLERAKWEHIKYVMAHSATFAEAARRLALHPRSLRRMLQKTPPPR